DNYTLFVKEVRTISGKLESRENYVPKRGPKQTKTWYISRLGNAPSNVESAPYIPQSTYHETSPLPAQDADDDTLMSGINGVSSFTIAAIINAINSKNNSRNDNSKKNHQPLGDQRVTASQPIITCSMR
ncbi:hypothetical protein K3495_g17442, partial [Podosphaera aphanis]